MSTKRHTATFSRSTKHQELKIPEEPPARVCSSLYRYIEGRTNTVGSIFMPGGEHFEKTEKI